MPHFTQLSLHSTGQNTNFQCWHRKEIPELKKAVAVKHMEKVVLALKK